MSGHYEETSPGVEQVAAELGHCRQRGLEWLDRDKHRQAPVPIPGLEWLARRYLSAARLPAPDRVAQIKTLLRHAVVELARQGHQADASLIRDLFFGDSTQTVMLNAGDLLSLAQRNAGELSEVRFRERRVSAFRTFAGFLLQFADAAERTALGTEQVRPAGASREVQVASGYVGERANRFVQLLADAKNVTIIGFTHEQLATALARALELKRARERRSDAFWSSLRIVFLSDALLGYVNDERLVSPNRREAVRERRQAMTRGRRSVRMLLRRTTSTRWELFESPFLPPFAGTLFQLPDGPHRVQLIIRRPEWATAEQLYFEFEDLADEYMTGAFEDTVRNSIRDNRAVPIGRPIRGKDGENFRCTEQRLRLQILKDGSNEESWLPLVMVVTTQQRGSQIQPLLQLRTEGNAVRELNRISHVSGHIYKEDHSQSPGASAVSAPLTLELGTDFVIRTAQRRVLEESGDDVPPAMLPWTTGRYLNHDKENLFFFVYRLDLPDEADFPVLSEMHHFPLPKLLAIRANHTLRLAARLCELTDLSGRLLASGAEIVSLNLTLHHYEELAARLLGLAALPPAGRGATAEEIGQLVEPTTISCTSLGKEVRITGMSGWQYREFFTVLLPLYAQSGVADESGQIEMLDRDERMRAACDRLAALYADEVLMRSLPIEL